MEEEESDEVKARCAKQGVTRSRSRCFTGGRNVTEPVLFSGHLEPGGVR